MIKFNRYFIPYIFLLIILGFNGGIIISFFMVFLHEFAHYVAARRLGFSGFDAEVLPIGAVLKVKDLDEATPKEDFLISISGPMLNLILAIIFYFMKSKVLFNTNITLCLFNFIPVMPLDGSRMLKDILLKKFNFKKANLLTLYISFFIGYMLIFLNIILFFKGKFNLNLAVISIFTIVCSYKEKERIAYIIMGNIIKKRYKIINRGYIENKNVSVYYRKNLLYVLGLVEKGRYNVFTIMDEELNVIDTIYEQELIDALKKYGNISVQEYITIKAQDF